VANLNIVPAVAGGGAVTIWLWLLALTLFFWPQGVAVVELSQRYPGEGGIYLWTKEVFGSFHGFLSGWFYWTNNVFYIPTLLLYLVGIAVYVGGSRGALLGTHRAFVFVAALMLLWLMVAVNIRGVGVGKWINNIGGVGTGITAVVLVGLAAAILWREGSRLGWHDMNPTGIDWHMLDLFGVICFALVGLELASVMGDEIEDPRRSVPRAVLWGGVLSGLLFVGATLSVLLALPKGEIGAVQGILQAISSMAQRVGVVWIVSPIAVLLTLAIAGTTSAWLSGSARIPFVAGLDNYLPAALGRLHPRYATPYLALATHGLLSCIFMAMSLAGASVEQAFKTLLLLAVVLQLIPFLYMYAALIRLAGRSDFVPARYSKSVLYFAGISGLLTTAVGMVVAFLPPADGGEPAWLFELKMVAGTLFFLVTAAILFLYYSRRTPAALQGIEKRVAAERP
jgi:amino acid transporter